MKKVLAVFMAILMAFTGVSMALAQSVETSVTQIDIPGGTEPGEKTTRDIQNDDGLVVPLNFKQLKMSIVFKIFEKIIKFILNLFAGDDAKDVDESIASVVESVADDVSGAIEEGSQFIEDNT